MLSSSDVIAYDFSSNSPITLIFFDGFAKANLAKRVAYYKKLIKNACGFDINVVSCQDLDNGQHYAAYYKGLNGWCDDVIALGAKLHHLLYVQNNTKRLIAFGDCAGSAPVILTSDIVVYHSMNFTTPYLEVIGRDMDYTISDQSMFIARDTVLWIHDNLTDMRPMYDTRPMLERHIESGVGVVNMHWAKSVYGTDLLFRDQVRHLESKMNVNVVEHDIPPTQEPHTLISWLILTRRYMMMVIDAVRVEAAALKAKEEQ